MNFKKYKEEFRQTIAKMNVAVDHHAKNENMMEFGRLQVLKDILQDMGHTVDGCMVTDKESGMQRAVYMTLDGESLGNFTGNPEGLFEVITPKEDQIPEAPADPEEKVEP